MGGSGEGTDDSCEGNMGTSREVGGPREGTLTPGGDGAISGLDSLGTSGGID